MTNRERRAVALATRVAGRLQARRLAAIAERAVALLPGDVAVAVEDDAVVLSGHALAARAWGRRADPRFQDVAAMAREGGR